MLPVAVLLFGGPAYLEARAAAAVTGAGATGAGATGTGATGTGAGVTGAKAAVLAVGAAAVLLGGWALWPGDGEGRERPAPSASGPPPSAVSEVPPSPSAAVTGSAPPSPSASASGTASPSPSPVPPEPGAPALGGPGTLRFVSTGSCLGVAAGAGARPVEAACDGGRDQRWVLLDPYEGDRGRTQVRNEASGLCLTRSGGTQDHAPVDQQVCDASRENQLWNLWTDMTRGEAALRTADGARYLGLVEWARADKDQAHGAAVGTTRYYYGSASMRFLVEPAQLGG